MKMLTHSAASLYHCAAHTTVRWARSCYIFDQNSSAIIFSLMSPSGGLLEAMIHEPFTQLKEMTHKPHLVGGTFVEICNNGNKIHYCFLLQTQVGRIYNPGARNTYLQDDGGGAGNKKGGGTLLHDRLRFSLQKLDGWHCLFQVTKGFVPSAPNRHSLLSEEIAGRDGGTE
ncbi:coiled-coil domain-containing protein 160 [Platysternon megacephalum]|uniref:Coiled-coil domain-containing protein 160 n=1 Tax=Platysternon megacephalum TaxID=55544 RepID=A0A4D9EX46_9SAUR|nr:coiled-coil domain-containing protein 160 [Platysternon megacephalum]